MIGRRMILAGAAANLATTAWSQQRPARVAILSIASSSIEFFRQFGLPELARGGYVEGSNLTLIPLSADGDAGKLPALAGMLVAMRPDVVVAVSNPAAHAIRFHDPALPIVMAFAGNDPVEDGLAARLSRPGGSVTGIVMLADELNIKRVELARDAFPSMRRIGYLAGSHLSSQRIEHVQSAVRSFGADIMLAVATGVDELDGAFLSLQREGTGAVVVASSPVLAGGAPRIAELALRAGLPTICEWKTMAEAGCLMSYGPDNRELRRRAATFVIRILRGERPGDIPMERPERFELVINLKTARALGQELPTHVLARADEVIE